MASLIERLSGVVAITQAQLGFGPGEPPPPTGAASPYVSRCTGCDCPTGYTKDATNRNGCYITVADPFPSPQDDGGQLAALIAAELGPVRTSASSPIPQHFGSYNNLEVGPVRGGEDVRRWYTPTFDPRSCCTSCALNGPCTGGDE